MLRRSSLQRSIVLLVVGTVMGLTLFFLFTVAYVTRRESQRAVAHDFQTTNAILQQTLDTQAIAMQQVGQSLVSRPDTFMANLMKGPQNPGDPDARQDWETVSAAARDVRDDLDANHNDLEADEVVVTDREGHILGESAGERQRDQHKKLAPYASVDLALRGKSWHGVVTHNGRLALLVSVPVQGPGQTYVVGTVSVFRSVGNALSKVIASALNCEVVFVTGKSISGQSAKLRALPPLPPPQKDGSLPPPFVVNSEGKSFLGSYQVIRFNPNDPPIGVLLLRPYDEATALPRALQEGLLVPFGITLLIALLIAAAIARRVTTSLSDVVYAARELREGRWPRRFEVLRTDEIGLLQSVFNEMTASMRTAQERLLALIDLDPLTELDNHRRFQERLVQEIQRANATGEPLALLLIDLDHFKTYNEAQGLVRGDEALKMASKSIVDTLPAFGLAARYGGEEFAVLVPGLGGAEIGLLAEQLRMAIARAASDTGLTASVGYTELGRDVAESATLTLAAELALTQAKQLGRNRVCSFDAVAGSASAIASDPIPLHRFLRDGSLATMQALAAAVDAKDPYTQGHSHRVADLALQMARQQGLSEEDAYLVFTTGTLHDVGKIGVPDRVLQKPGRLDTEERLLMETHPVLGEVIVGKAPQLASALPGVRSHHERWDGKGYPDGLAGAGIPLIARILALADTYDAMTSDRPYRKGLAIDIALSEIRRNAGIQFDPDLSLVFVAMIEEMQPPPRCQ